ncbi:MAG: HD domain-containing protein [Desulfomonile tiedjei]|nr:HD domain-containing protein [Desulfomonile tiedjei]
MEDRTAKVLVVCQEPEALEELSGWFASEGYSCVTTTRSDDADKLLRSDRFDLVLGDLDMPGLPAADLLALVQTLPSIPAVLTATTLENRETAAMSVEAGADSYILKPFMRKDVLIHAAAALKRPRQVSAAEDQAAREREEEIVFRLLAAIGRRSDETEEHVRRVGLYASVLADGLGWAAEPTREIRLAAALHDIGEVAIPDSILVKAGRLSPEEYALMKKHTEIGANALDGSELSVLRMARDIALAHHEKWDGTGYPKGIVGEDIPECARIVAIADVYDALLSERVYRLPLSEDEAFAIMVANKGKYFDPRIFDCFLRLLPEFRMIRGLMQDDDDLSIDFSELL